MPGAPGTDVARQREAVDAFLAAARGGDFEALLAVLDPDAELRVDATAAGRGAAAAQRGPALARSFAGRAAAAVPALVNGAAGLVWVHEGRPRVILAFTVGLGGRITSISLAGDPGQLATVDLELLAP
jgi:RNA polymerase sigma-70 factor (ECF subfamily)